MFLFFFLSFLPVVVLSETNQASVGAILQKAILEPEKLNSPAVPPKSELENLSYKISSATGIAISPLVVAGCLGCYHWWVAPSEERSQLNIFYQPYAWGTFLGLGLLFLINSFIGTVIPFLKKPMDFVETIEHAVSGLLIGLPLILLMNLPADFQLAGSATGTGQVTAGFVPSFLAIDSWFSNALTWVFWIPVFGVCFFSVWALSQFLNLLIYDLCMFFSQHRDDARLNFWRRNKHMFTDGKTVFHLIKCLSKDTEDSVIFSSIRSGNSLCHFLLKHTG